MQTFLISIAIGLVAAIIDTTPMIIMKLDHYFITSAFTFWIIAVPLIQRINLTGNGWLNGILTVWLIFLPLLILILKVDRSALLQICITTTILAAGSGAALSYFIK